MNFFAFYPENGHFLAKNGQKFTSIGQKLLLSYAKYIAMLDKYPGNLAWPLLYNC